MSKNCLFLQGAYGSVENLEIRTRFQHFPRDPANAIEWKIIVDPSIVTNALKWLVFKCDYCKMCKGLMADHHAPPSFVCPLCTMQVGK